MATDRLTIRGVQFAYEIRREAERIEMAASDDEKLRLIRRVNTMMQSALRDLPACVQAIPDFHDVQARTLAMEKVWTAVRYVQMAYGAQDQQSEAGFLRGAMNVIRERDITDADFDIALIFPEGTGEIIQIGNIVARLKELRGG